MVSNSLKIAGAFITLSSSAAGYYAYSKNLFNLWRKIYEEYLIVKSITNDETNNYEINPVSKDYSCSIIEKAQTSGEKLIDDCEIQKLTNDEKKLSKIIDNNPDATNEEIVKNGNYFKIKSPKLMKFMHLIIKGNI